MRARQNFLFLTLWLAITLTLACGGSSDESFDRQALEQAEDSSESLANDLLAFSVAVRDRDAGAIAGFVAEQVRASEIPAAPSEPGTIVKWIRGRDWAWSNDVETIPREVFVERLQLLLGRFSEIEDARFKVVGAEFEELGPEPVEGRVDTNSGLAKIKFFLIARDEEGRREWVKGKGDRQVCGCERILCGCDGRPARGGS